MAEASADISMRVICNIEKAGNKAKSIERHWKENISVMIITEIEEKMPEPYIVMMQWYRKSQAK